MAKKKKETGKCFSNDDGARAYFRDNPHINPYLQEIIFSFLFFIDLTSWRRDACKKFFLHLSIQRWSLLVYEDGEQRYEFVEN